MDDADGSRTRPNPTRVLIAGCGYVGQALAAALEGAGHRVWGLRRNADSLPATVRPIAADLTRAETLADLPAGLDYVVYAAAAGERSREAYRAAYVDGARNLLEALAEQGQEPRRFFFVSSTAVYGQDDGEWVDETSPTEPGHWSGRLLLEAERRIGRANVPATVVRFGGIYGPGRTRLVEQVRAGEATLTAEPLYTNRIHRDDCAGALAHLIELDRRGAPLEELYLGVDRVPAERGAVLGWLAERLGVSPPELAAASPRRRGGNKRCSNARLLATGYAFRYPGFREGYGEIVER